MKRLRLAGREGKSPNPCGVVNLEHGFRHIPQVLYALRIAIGFVYNYGLPISEHHHPQNLKGNNAGQPSNTTAYVSHAYDHVLVVLWEELRKLRHQERLWSIPYFAVLFLLRSQVMISPFLALVKILLAKAFSGSTIWTLQGPSRRTHFRDPRPHRSKSYRSSNRSPPRSYGKLQPSVFARPLS